MTDFRDMWLQTVSRFPDQTAIHDLRTGTSASYLSLHASASAVADHVRDRSAEAGELVGLRTHDRHQFCVGLLGLWLADAVPVPLSATAPSTYTDALLRRLGIGTVLTGDEISTDGASGSADHRESRRAVESARPELAYVMHTSGSTGQPKAVALSHRALATYCTAFAAAVDLHRSDQFLQLAPVTFDVVFEELLPIWSVGGTAVLARTEAADPSQLLADIEANGVTVAELTTAYWVLLVRHLRTAGRLVPPSLRLLLMGGELASTELLDESLRLGLPLAHVYGVTEAGITSTLKRFTPGARVTAASVGSVLANSRVHVVGDAGNPLPFDTPGEVWIGGAGLADGYLRDPAETARRFVENGSDTPLPGRFYRTGDAGRITPDGELVVLGRIDAPVKISGVRVDVSEVEATLRNSPLVADAAVIAVRAAGNGHRLRAFVLLEDGVDDAQIDVRLRRSLSELLPAVFVPDQIITLEALPVTEHGKIDRTALAARRDSDCDDLFIRGLSGNELRVATAWVQALGRPITDLDQNFGDAGGTSLHVLALVIALQETGVTITALDCLTYPTVRSFAAYLDGVAQVDTASTDHTGPDAPSEQQRAELRSQYRNRRRTVRGSTR